VRVCSWSCRVVQWKWYAIYVHGQHAGRQLSHLYGLRWTGCGELSFRLHVCARRCMRPERRLERL
jgi:hypothetical protein